MIKQCAVSTVSSRSECSPYNDEGFLPIITSPMFSVISDDNLDTYLSNKVQACLPRGSKKNWSNDYFVSLSLDEFINSFINTNHNITAPIKICIDTAAGNLKILHDAIIEAKSKYGNNIIIMSGNCGSVESFVSLAKTGVDYIRVGIGGGGGCNTTSNTGVGQEDLEELIESCFYYKNRLSSGEQTIIFTSRNQQYFTKKEALLVSNVKIVADGISTYIKQCETKYGFNNNGYAAINKLLFAGADLVMVGKLFAQCLESAGKKLYPQYESDEIVVKYSGMSTQLEQEKYKSEYYWKWWWGDATIGSVKDETVFYNFDEMKTHSSKHSFLNSICNQNYYSNYTKHKNTKPSEGSVQWIPVRWTLDEWLHGSNNQDEAPYLMGWVNSIKSAMAYTNKTKL